MSELLSPKEALVGLERYRPEPAPCAVDVSDNTNLWGPSPAAARAVHQVALETLSRYPEAKPRALCAALAAYAGVEAEQVVTGCGSDDVIECALRAFAEPGERVAFCTPTFTMLPSFARVNGLAPCAITFCADGELDVAGLIALRPRVTYVASPNNPTGREVSPPALERLLNAAPGLVIVDEAYGEFANHSAIPWLQRYPHLFVTRTLSKAFGLAGLRIGYGLGARAVVAAVELVRGPYKLNAVGERAALAALGEDLEWMATRAAEVRTVRERLAGELRRMGLRPLASGANFLCLPVADGAWWGERLLARGVRVRVFLALPGVGDALRIGVGPWVSMEPVLSALGAVAKESRR